MKKRIMIFLCLLLGLCTPAGAESFVYGTSELGRELICHRLGGEAAEKSILMVFAVHGFEDARDHDGEILVEIAQRLIAHYEQTPESMAGFALYIIPCANPDGLIDGVSENGFGRLNANKLDINRDFPVKWTPKTTARNRTGDQPFATAEARAIRDLVESVRPTYGIDVHGWINGVYGSKDLAQVFHESFGFPMRDYKGGGMLGQWLQTQTEAAVMIELPGSPGRKNYVENNTQKLVDGLDAWMREKM